MTAYTITIDPDNPPLVDPGHAGIRLDLDGSLQTGTIPTEEGEKGVLTIRTGNTTLTVVLARDGLQAWIAKLTELDQKLPVRSGLIAVSRGGIIPVTQVPAP